MDTDTIAHPQSPEAAANSTALERHATCGWFESSHELLCGLAVRVHDSPDAVAAELPLDVWIAWHLALSQRGAAHATGCA